LPKRSSPIPGALKKKDVRWSRYDLLTEKGFSSFSFHLSKLELLLDQLRFMNHFLSEPLKDAICAAFYLILIRFPHFLDLLAMKNSLVLRFRDESLMLLLKVSKKRSDMSQSLLHLSILRLVKCTLFLHDLKFLIEVTHLFTGDSDSL
jgi:hypothetical protein